MQNNSRGSGGIKRSDNMAFPSMENALRGPDADKVDKMCWCVYVCIMMMMIECVCVCGYENKNLIAECNNNNLIIILTAYYDDAMAAVFG